MMFLELVCMFTPVLGIVGAARYAAQFTGFHLDEIAEGDTDVER